MKKTIASTLSFAIALGGCATASKDVATAYVSPIQFSNYTCDQIIAESARLQVRVNQLEGRLDTAAANDAVLTGVALVLFWPAVFALGGTKEQEAEYARLKGEHEALKQVWIQKNCSAATAAAGSIPPAGTNPSNASQAGAVAPTPFQVGDRLTYRLREPVSGSAQGEVSQTISMLSDQEVGFDENRLVIGKNGSLSKGSLAQNAVLGVDVARLNAGNKIPGTLRVIGASKFDNPVDLLVLGQETMDIAGRRITAVRLEITGLVKGGGGYNAGAPITGALVIDAATGIVISMKVKSQVFAFGTDRTLVDITNPSGAGPKPAAAPAAQAPSTPPSVGSPQPQSKEDRLKELKHLFDTGLISQEVYTAQQKAILQGN